MKRRKQEVKVIEGDKIVTRKADLRCFENAIGELYQCAIIKNAYYRVCGEYDGQSLFVFDHN